MNSPRTRIFFVPDENILLTLLWFRPNIRLKQAKQPTTEQDEMTTTQHSGLETIILEARSISFSERQAASQANATKLMAIRKTSGRDYMYSVEQAMFQLEIFENKKVIKVSAPMPFYEFNGYLSAFEV